MQGLGGDEQSQAEVRADFWESSRLREAQAPDCASADLAVLMN